MKIVIKEAYGKPEVKEIEGTLEEMQSIVGGYIECVNIPRNIIMVCNEEGKLRVLPPNILVNGEIIYGDVFFCSSEGTEFVSLDDDQIGFLMSVLSIF